MNLDAWLLKHLGMLKFNSESSSWIRAFFPNLYDYRSEISIDGRVFKGRSIREDEDLALKISIIEAIERTVCIRSGLPTTNGVAAHTDLHEAQKRSCFELIERDLFLSHYLTGSPFQMATDLLSHLPKTVHIFFEKTGDSLSFYRMKINNLGEGIVCLISGNKNWGGVIGLAFGDEDLTQLALSSFLESFRQYWYLRESNLLLTDITLNEFTNLNSWNFRDHQKLCLNLDFFNRISFLFSEITQLKPGIIHYEKNEFQFQPLKLLNAPFDSCPIHVIQCTSPLAQSLYVGPASERNISIEGLKRFTNSTSLPTLNPLPHPLS